MDVSAMTFLLSLYLLMMSVASMLASLVLESTRFIPCATILAFKFSLHIIRPLAVVFGLLWLVEFILRLLNAAEAKLRTQKKGSGTPAADSVAAHERYHRIMCGQQFFHAVMPSSEEIGRASVAAAAARDETAVVDEPARVPQQAQVSAEPAVTEAPKATGNVRRRLLLGEVVGAAVAAIEKRVEEEAKSAAAKEGAGVKKGNLKAGTVGVEKKGNGVTGKPAQAPTSGAAAAKAQLARKLSTNLSKTTSLPACATPSVSGCRRCVACLHKAKLAKASSTAAAAHNQAPRIRRDSNTRT